MNKNPLINVCCEIRFDSKQNESDVCNLLKDCINKKHLFKTNFVQQEVIKLPEEVRNQSGHLKCSPHYVIEEDSRVLGVGPHVLLMGTECYQGIGDFSSFVKEGIDVLKECNISSVNQIRLVYINRIDDSITESTNLHIAINDESVKLNDDYEFHIEYEMSENCRIALRICNNNAYIPGKDDESSFSVVDLRAKYDIRESSEIYDKLIEAHDNIKMVFKKVMNQEYLKTKWGLNDL